MNWVRWARHAFDPYWANAAAKRDFRVQLRGSRSVVLFAIYLFVLIGVGMFVYWQTAGSDEISVIDAQSKLQGFYQVVMVLLGSIVCLVAPALTATTVVMERQRKSLDLVFSAPVSVKYYLVGKMISSYRYTWMLLILSLPVTATCVVLGGASWSDVLIAYVLLSLQALLLTSVGLLMSTIAVKPVSAIIYSYLITILFLVSTSMFGGALAVSSFVGSASREVNFLAAMSPFFVAPAADTYTIIGSIEVPNWILVALTTLTICRLAVLTSGAVLAPFGSKELPSLRISLIIVTCLSLLYAAYALTTMGGVGIRAGSDLSTIGGQVFAFITAPLFIFMPFLSCFGLDAERRYKPNGVFRFRHTLDGSPAGGLPFLWIFLGLGAASFCVGIRLAIAWPGIVFWFYVLFAIGFWTMFWAAGRLVSSFFLGLRGSRILQFTCFVVVVLLPATFLPSLDEGGNSPFVWNYYILRPLLSHEPLWQWMALVYGAVMLGIAIALAWIAERKIATRLSIPPKTNERSLATA